MPEQAEQVYNFIWQYVTEKEALPSQYQIALALLLTKNQVSQAVSNLRSIQQIEPRTLLPTAYGSWWRDNLRARWVYPT